MLEWADSSEVFDAVLLGQLGNGNEMRVLVGGHREVVVGEVNCFCGTLKGDIDRLNAPGEVLREMNTVAAGSLPLVNGLPVGSSINHLEELYCSWVRGEVCSNYRSGDVACSVQHNEFFKCHYLIKKLGN